MDFPVAFSDIRPYPVRPADCKYPCCKGLRVRVGILRRNTRTAHQQLFQGAGVAQVGGAERILH